MLDVFVVFVWLWCYLLFVIVVVDFFWCGYVVVVIGLVLYCVLCVGGEFGVGGRVVVVGIIGQQQ